ncbi:hypothetical protein H0O03_04865 [Candidatus Micrarchaeota archaeon]|nr:hypothetical protein [Candidatus Micrarchaeota archaeon]
MVLLRRGEIYSEYHGLVKAVVEQGHLVVEHRGWSKKRLFFRKPEDYAPPAFGIGTIERIEVKKFSAAEKARGLAREADRILDAVQNYRQKAKLPTPWLARMEANLQLIGRKLAEASGEGPRARGRPQSRHWNVQ